MIKCQLIRYGFEVLAFADPPLPSNRHPSRIRIDLEHIETHNHVTAYISTANTDALNDVQSENLNNIHRIYKQQLTLHKYE